MRFLHNIRAKREIRKILNSNDSEKIESVREISEDEEIEKIILSIEDKQKRAKAFEQNIQRIDNKDVLKKIIPTLKDDDILKLLRKKEKYLNNEERNILYTTISGIANLDKRMDEIDMFKYSLSDAEVSKLLDTIKDEKEENKYEDRKIEILTDKIIENYISTRTIMHIDYLLWCLQHEKSKIMVLKKCLDRSRKLEEKNHKLFDTEAKIMLTNKVFSKTVKVGKSNIIDRMKVDMIFTMFKKDEINYEQAREIVEKNVQNETIIEQTKNALLKQEAKKIKINKDSEIEISNEQKETNTDNEENER